jgi:hypothetical protein
MRKEIYCNNLKKLEEKLPSIDCQGMRVENVFRFASGRGLKSKKIIESKCRFKHFCNDGWYVKRRALRSLKYVDLDWAIPYEKKRAYRGPENSDDTLFFEDVDNFNIESIFIRNRFPSKKYFDGEIFLLCDPKSKRVFWYLWFD